jgi:hypothetical protein
MACSSCHQLPAYFGCSLRSAMHMPGYFRAPQLPAQVTSATHMTGFSLVTYAYASAYANESN